MFDWSLARDEATPLETPECEEGQIGSDWNLYNAECQTGKMALLSLLMMRGKTSNQLYQPNMNRTMVYQAFLEPHGETTKQQPPLLQSMVDKAKGAFGLDMSSSTTTFLYEIRADTEDNQEGGIALSTLSSNMYLKATEQNCRGFIEGYNAHGLSATGFRRLCAVFNLEWTKSSVEMKDLVAFARIFKDCDVTSTDAMQETVITKFGLEGVYKIEKGKTITTCLDEFGKVLRALTNVRLASPEGQHRWAISAYCSTGFFNPTNIVPLEPTNMKGCPLECVQNAKWEDLQIHHHQKVRFISVIKNGVMELPLKALAEYSKTSSVASTLKVDTPMEIHVTDILHRLQSCLFAKWKNGEKDFIFKGLNYQNFWTAGKDMTHIMRFLTDVTQDIEKNFGTSQDFENAFSTNQKPWDNQKQTVYSQFKDPLAIMVNLDKTPTGKNLEHLFFLLKLAALSPDRGATMRTLLSKTPGRKVTAQDKHMDGVKSICDWLAEDVYRPLSRVTKTFATKAEAEYILIQTLRQFAGIQNEIVVPEGKQKDIWESTDIRKLMNEKSVSKLESLCGFASTSGNLKPSNDVPKRNDQALKRIEFAATITMMNDIMDTIKQHGFNPVIPFDENKPSMNKYARVYLK